MGPETTRLLAGFKDKMGRIFKTSADNMKHQVNRLVHSAGVDGVTAHGLRKYFKAQMEHARVPEQYILHMMGKKSSVYSEKRVSQLFEAYRKAYPELSLYTQKNQTEEIEKLKRRVNQLMELRLQEDEILGRVQSLMHACKLYLELYFKSH